MKHLFLILLLLSCGPHYNTNTELVMEYEGKVQSVSHPLFNTHQELKNAIGDGNPVDFTIFASTWCDNCKILMDLLEGEKWRDKVLVMNVDDPWVRDVARDLNLTGVPGMYVSLDDGDTATGPFYGAGDIYFILNEAFGEKK